jgi:hypothetical protein
VLGSQLLTLHMHVFPIPHLHRKALEFKPRFNVDRYSLLTVELDASIGRSSHDGCHFGLRHAKLYHQGIIEAEIAASRHTGRGWKNQDRAANRCTSVFMRLLGLPNVRAGLTAELDFEGLARDVSKTSATRAQKPAVAGQLERRVRQ